MSEQKTEAVQMDIAVTEPDQSNERGIPEGIKADELPAETLMDFSNAPIEFEETALMVMEDTQRLYYHAGTANRFSENYLKYSSQLESYIRKAGSLCLMKSVLEQKGQAFPKLTDLSILELVRMVSFHIRKTHAAINGLYQDNNKLGMVYFQQEIRWINLCDRLKVTGEKIERIKNGEINVDSLVKREEITKDQPRTNEGNKTGLPLSLQVNPKALPLDRSMAAEMLQQEQNRKKQQKKNERLQRSLENDMGIKPFEPDLFWLEQMTGGKTTAADDDPVEFIDDEDLVPEETYEIEDDDPIEYISEAEGRRFLIEDAMRRGDQQALMEIPLEDSETFRERWMRRMDELEREERCGPNIVNSE